jgi:hypothetical protein
VLRSTSWGPVKVGNGRRDGNGNCGFCERSNILGLFFLGERSIPHRQCWEQERTTCSGGCVNANNCENTQMLINV